MRTALSRVLCAAVIGATAAGVGTLYAAVEPVPGTPHMSWDGKAQLAGCSDLSAPGTLGRTQCMGVAIPTHTADEYIEEDSPEWDCRTMGNRICGPLPVGTEVTVSGKPWVVTVSGLEPVSAN